MRRSGGKLIARCLCSQLRPYLSLNGPHQTANLWDSDSIGGRVDAAVAPQAILAQLVLVGTLFLVTALRPYARPVDNWLSIVSLAGELKCRRTCFRRRGGQPFVRGLWARLDAWSRHALPCWFSWAAVLEFWLQRHPATVSLQRCRR